jgi:hypothetical protein
MKLQAHQFGQQDPFLFVAHDMMPIRKATLTSSCPIPNDHLIRCLEISLDTCAADLKSLHDAANTVTTPPSSNEAILCALLPQATATAGTALLRGSDQDFDAFEYC